MIVVNRIGGCLGAEVYGVDLSVPLASSSFEQVRRAFFEHEVVVFRGQTLAPEQQLAFTRRFGELEHHVRRESCLAGFPEILVVSNVLDAAGRALGVQDAGRFWHSDLSYKREPSLLSALYALEVPVREGRALGDTSFASATAAYDALPEEMKQRLQGLRNVHSYRYYREKNARAQAEEAAANGRRVQEHTPDAQQFASVPDVEMPVVRTHPVTGRKALFVNEAHTSHLVGLEPDESARLLGELYRHLTRPEFVYRHRWQPGDLLMWDNCAVQHKANFDYQLPLRRRMYRTTVHGSAPF
ncbi:MAG TPA: TauD/TfdA family dioxygenase [Burkholderiales bacterium]|nr:TauD/TfdA family dioxygenase [Burkholderiales bacterium]